jgi:hypothetical protein
LYFLCDWDVFNSIVLEKDYLLQENILALVLLQWRFDRLEEGWKLPMVGQVRLMDTRMA